MYSMKLFAFILFFEIVANPLDAFSQQEINQVDGLGRPHGIWKKYYEGTPQLRYEGEFKHGKEVGEFKFYCEDCKESPEAIKIFSNRNDVAQVKFFKKGKIISEGKMKGKERIGEWVTYHPNSDIPMIKETYSDGKLHGRKTVYYSDGKVTEELDYSNGLKNGRNTYYSTGGVAIKKLQYKNDKLHGPAEYYDGHGALLIEGTYKEGRKDGLWKYYKNGKLVLEETYPKKIRE